MLVWLSGYIAIYNSQEVLGSILDMYSFFSLLYNQCKIINLLNGVHQSSLESNPLHQCIPVTKVHMDSTWTVQSSGLQWTPVHSSHD